MLQPKTDVAASGQIWKDAVSMHAGHIPNFAFVSRTFGGHSLATFTAIVPYIVLPLHIR